MARHPLSERDDHKPPHIDVDRVYGLMDEYQEAAGSQRRL